MKKQLIILLVFTTFLVSAQDRDTRYENAYNTLSEMLEGKRKLSFKKAVFTVENAYKDGLLDTIYLEKRLGFLKRLTKAFIENSTFEYQESDKETVGKYAGIFTVMNDTIPLQNQHSEITKHLPFTYDFEDFFGHEDWGKMFVSKLLYTRKGNCHSLPYLYKIIAEEMGVEAHLALAPNHIYIKHQSKKNGWYNTELTSGIFPIDAWLMASGYIHLDAIVNGVYMKALNDKESIALCLVDLAQGYQKSEFYDLDFVIKCANKALEYFPNYVSAMILKTEAKGKKIELMLEGRNKTFSDVLKYDDTKKIFLEIQSELSKIHQLGYRQMPEEMYLDWLVSLKEEKDKYANKKISTFKQP